MLRFYWLISLLFFTSVIQGQNAEKKESTKDTFAYSINLEDFVITAQYRPTHYKNVLHKIDIIEEDLITKRGATQLDQALLISPVIRLEPDPVLGTQVRMRGISSRNVAILIDGVPVIGRLDGGIDLSQISTQNIERIEIVEGPLSNIYGNNAAGGVINIITRKSQIQKFSLNANSQVESIGATNHQLGFGYRFGKFLISGQGRYYRYDQYPMDSLRLRNDYTLNDGTVVSTPKYPWNPKEQYGLGSKLSYQLNDDHKLHFKFDFNEEDVSDFGPIKRPQYLPYANDAFYNSKRKDFTFLYKGQLPKNQYIDFTLAYNLYDRITEEKRYFIESGEFDEQLQTREINKFTALFSKLNYAKTIEDKWEFMAGFNYNYETGEGNRIVDPSKGDSTQTENSEIAFYGEIKYKPISSLQLSASGRWLNQSNYGQNFTPSIQAMYNLSEKWILKAGYAQGYRSPSLKELYLEFIDINHYVIGNPALQPEISTDIQGSVIFNPSEHLSINLNGYSTMIKNRITLVEYEPLKYTYENIDEYDVYGFQTGLSWKWENFVLQSSASLGYWSTGIKDSDAPSHGKTFDMNHNLSYILDPIELGLNANYRLVGEQPSYVLVNDEAELITLGSMHFIDFSMDRTFLKGKINIVAGVKNILDIQTATLQNETSSGIHVGAGSRAVSTGRSFYLNLGIRL